MCETLASHCGWPAAPLGTGGGGRHAEGEKKRRRRTKKMEESEKEKEAQQDHHLDDQITAPVHRHRCAQAQAPAQQRSSPLALLALALCLQASIQQAIDCSRVPVGDRQADRDSIDHSHSWLKLAMPPMPTTTTTTAVSHVDNGNGHWQWQLPRVATNLEGAPTSTFAPRQARQVVASNKSAANTSDDDDLLLPDGAQQVQELWPSKPMHQQVASKQVLPAGQAPSLGPANLAQGPSEQQTQQMAAYAAAQELNKAANKLNAELCRNFSIGLQQDNGGVFTSPNYPNPYPVNLVCTKLIEAPVGYYIVLEFRDQFNIEEAGVDCDNDKIEIRDGRYGYSKVLARYCGSKFPQEVKSSAEAMWLRFISDASISHTGFKAVYRFEKQKNIKPNPPFECRFNVTSMTAANYNGTENRTGIHSGVIRNTDVPDKLIDYTKNFNVSLECIWNITVMPGWKIYLTFSNYELNKPNDCDSNFIEIYEENLTEENQTVKFCGTRTEPQQSKSNIFNIRHHALPTASGSRFEIIYTAFRDKGLEGCDAREFDCDDGTCIHESLKCDGQINCKYRYDEAHEPGPCQGELEGDFFDAEHMVIILIVFLTLVGGMCASIIVSCWGKIQERRRRKQEYHMRKSREASMEGQLNKVDQVVYGSTGGGDRSQASSSGNLKQRVMAAGVVPAENNIMAIGAQTNAKLAALHHQDSASLSQQQQHLIYQQHHPGLLSQMLASQDGSYGAFGANGGMIGLANSQSSLELMKDDNNSNKLGGLFHNQQQQQQRNQQVNKSLQNVQQSMLANMAAAQHQQHQQKLADFGQSNNKQQSVPDISLSNQFKKQQPGGLNLNSLSGQQLGPDGLVMANAREQEANRQRQQQQQMLNLSLARSQLSQQKYISSIYQQQQNQLDNISNSNSNGNNTSTSNNHFGRFLRHQQNHAASGQEPGAHQGFLSQSVASSQTIPAGPISQSVAAKYMSGAADGGQQLNYDTTGGGGQFNALAAYNPQRALTLSTMHCASGNQHQQQQPPQSQRNLQAIYGLHPSGSFASGVGQPLNANNLSSSVTCCNLLASGETPLISDLLARAGGQQQQRVQFPQNNRIYELKSATMGPRVPAQAIPRSISAHQLSRSQLRHSQSQQQQPQQQQQQHQHQQHQHQHQQQHQLPYKSISDASATAAHVIRHQPPNHSLSYPHACTGTHLEQQQQLHIMQRGSQSPGLPPPPPPPNLTAAGAVGRSATSCGQFPAAAGGQQSATLGDSRRAAFKVSRLDQSQLTSDTLQDQMELQLPHHQQQQHFIGGSLQFDEPSTESEGTFGMLMAASGGQQQLYMTQPPPPPSLKGYQQQQRMLTHLSECNLIRRQRSLMNQQRQDLAAAASGNQTQQALVCDCGAMDRAQAEFRRQQHQHQIAAGSSHEFDDSDEQAACMIQSAQIRQQQPAGSFVGLDVNNMILGSQQQHNAQQQQQQSNKNQLQQHSSNGGLYAQRQQFARFKQQSSELTGDDDDEDDDEDEDDEEDGGSHGGRRIGDDEEEEEELDGYHDDEDDELEEEMSSSDAMLPPPPPPLPPAAGSSAAASMLSPPHRQQQVPSSLRPAGKSRTGGEEHGGGTYRAVVVTRRNEQLLRDADGPASQTVPTASPSTALGPRPGGGRHLGDSHTSISCQSCTCGSQLRLDRAGVLEPTDDSSGDGKSVPNASANQTKLVESSDRRGTQPEEGSGNNNNNNYGNTNNNNLVKETTSSANNNKD